MVWQADLEKRHVALLRSFLEDLHVVEDHFHSECSVSSRGSYLEREGPPVYYNMPPISGAVAWCRALLDRLELQMQRLELTMRLMLDTDEVRRVPSGEAHVRAWTTPR